MDIKNFCIIAHIDHWKSTLADRMLEITGTLDKRDMKNAQILDKMELEQERGITIKLQPVRMNYKGIELNLIDTPWHVDFQYEVSRSLASCEGAILVVDATQGMEAQTLSNLYMAIWNDLDIIPVINKIDLPAANVPKVSKEIINLIWCEEDEIICVSAKTWENVESVLDAIISRVSKPEIYTNEDENGETKALVFDSQYDTYRWVVSYVKVFSWSIKKGDSLHFLNTWKKIEALDVWYFAPDYTSSWTLDKGQIWYIVTWLKSIRDARVWDTMWQHKPPQGWPRNSANDAKAIEWFSEATPFVYAWMFPLSTDEYPALKEAIDKLMLNDSALTKENEVSPALWHWYRCWFLGLLHLDIVKERMLREFNIDVIMTSPQVTYRIKLMWDKSWEYDRFSPEVFEEHWQVFTYAYVSNPEDVPRRELYIDMQEPISKCEILTPSAYVWALMQLCQERRGIFINQQYMDDDRIMLVYELPTAELIWDFYDELKSLSSGYASMNYEFLKYKTDDLVKLDILVAWDKIDALSIICHKELASKYGWKICKNLKDTIPRQLFKIALQWAIWGKIVAREDISAMRKDVTAKLYWWDISRKRKLLDKQKEGKKKMKKFGKVDIPSEAFVNLLKK